jgi:hypothetical protein
MAQDTRVAGEKSKAGAGGFPEVHVHIKDSIGHTDNDHAHVSKGDHKEVRWHAHDDESATIEFDKSEGSPFIAGPHFDVPANDSVPSGQLKPEVQPGSHYRYTVYAPAGPYDPEVIIDP